jgi:hypothetical protein
MTGVVSYLQRSCASFGRAIEQTLASPTARAWIDDVLAFASLLLAIGSLFLIWLGLS